MTEQATVTPLEPLRNPDWPKAVGWRILIDPLKPKSVSDGGILIVDETQHAQKCLNYVGRVVDMGPLCYKHAKFEGGDPWCKIGDWIAYQQHAGQAIITRDEEQEERIKEIGDEIRTMQEAVKAADNKCRLAAGTDKRVLANKDRDELQELLVAKQLELIATDELVEHELRLLSDDAVLAVIPKAEAIKIYL